MKIIEIDNKIILLSNKKVEFTEESIIKSLEFSYILKKFLKEQTKFKFNQNISKTAEHLTDIFLLLLMFPIDKLQSLEVKYYIYLSSPKKLYTLVEDLYTYWKQKESFLVLCENKNINNNTLLSTYEQLNDTVLKVYRKISQNIINYQFNVFRELPAGINAAFLIQENEWNTTDYLKLKGLFFINAIVFKPPFISYTKKNKRTSNFKLINENPLDKMYFKKDDWLVYPIFVGTSLAYIYVNYEYLGSCLGLANLYEHPINSKYLNKKPDIIVIYGGIGEFEDGVYYDKTNDIYVGALKKNINIDYFGYLKKIILTCYNLKMINNHNLPINGSGIHIELKNGKSKNIILIGEARAGKSEVTEALKQIGKNYINDITIIFDDMGTLILNEKNEPYAYGTETGAFIRTDDLDNGYVYKVLDRVIFTNPNQNNSRCILPISTYEDITKGYKVDMILYANNYEDKTPVSIFNDKTSAKTCFIEGKRMANSSKNSVVQIFFANPFGPLQMPEETSKIINHTVDVCFDNNLILGEIYTRLGFDKSGPKKAAVELLRLITK